MQNMFSDLSLKLNGKLNHVISEIAQMKIDLAVMKHVVAELEHSVEDTSAKFTIIEKEELPKIKRDILDLSQ